MFETSPTGGAAWPHNHEWSTVSAIARGSNLGDVRYEIVLQRQTSRLSARNRRNSSASHEARRSQSQLSESTINYNNLSDPRQRIEQTIAKTGSMWRLTFMTMTIMRLNFAAPIDYSVSSDGAVFRAERLPSAISTAEDEPRTSSETSVCPPASGISLVEVSLVAESPPLPLPLISPGTVSEAGATGISPVAGASTVDAASACAAV